MKSAVKEREKSQRTRSPLKQSPSRSSLGKSLGGISGSHKNQRLETLMQFERENTVLKHAEQVKVKKAKRRKY